jgi:hypothetical protein
MALAHCILGEFLGVGCHCFPPPLEVPTFSARCLYVQRRERPLAAEGGTLIGRKTFRQISSRIRLTPNSRDHIFIYDKYNYCVLCNWILQGEIATALWYSITVSMLCRLVETFRRFGRTSINFCLLTCDHHQDCWFFYNSILRLSRTVKVLSLMWSGQWCSDISR